MEENEKKVSVAKSETALPNADATTKKKNGKEGTEKTADESEILIRCTRLCPICFLIVRITKPV